MILFPEVFGNKRRIKYDRASTYLLTRFNAVCASLRDPFTAGKNVRMTIGTRTYTVPSIYKRLRENAQEINQTITELNVEVVKKSWNLTDEPADRLIHWKDTLNANASGLPAAITAFDIYEAGLG
jgi:hypothetical protein